MQDFFYGLPKWAGWLITIVFIIFVIGLLGNFFLG